MRALRRSLLLAGLGSLLVAGVGCAPATPPAAAPAGAPSAPAAPGAGGPPAAASPAPVTLGYGVTGLLATYWPSFVGMNRGYFADQGITLDILLTESSARAGQTIAGGSVEISNHSPETTMLAVEKYTDTSYWERAQQ